MNARPSHPFPAWPVGFTPGDQQRWQRVFARIIKVEGGWSDDRADRGGATKYGISLRFAKALGHIDANRDGFADLDLNLDTVIDGQDIRKITPQIAEGLYFEHFWIGPGFWTLPATIDSAMFDQAVHAGTTAAIRLIRASCPRSGLPLPDDGALGPLTRRAIDRACARDKGRLLDIFRQEAANRYRAIVSVDPTQARFLTGWLRRAQELGHV